MTQTQRPPKVRFDKPKDRLNPARTEKEMRRIVVLIAEITPAWVHAVEGGAYQIRRETNGRGTGFHDSDPTHSAAQNPMQRQLRASARQAATDIAKAAQMLEDAAQTLHNGLMRTDPEVWAEYLEKRRAATQE